MTFVSKVKGNYALCCPYQNGVFRSIFKNLFCPLVSQHFDLGSLSSLIPKYHEKPIGKNMTRLR